MSITQLPTGPKTPNWLQKIEYILDPLGYLDRSYQRIYLTHYREDLYPNPKQFRPERFLERQYTPYEFFPFGGGVRRCIGEALAMFEMKLVLATILKNYQLVLAENQTVTPQRRGVVIAPKGGVKMVLKEARPN